MPETPPPDVRRADRSDAERSVDHAAIERLAGELLPALVAKLGATGLGELEVREGGWRVRLRRPAGNPDSHDRRASERPVGERGERGVRGERAAERSTRPVHHSTDGTAAGTRRTVATSPAVGIFQPRAQLAPGTRVRTGDRLGAVDMLGIPQEVVSPIDGIVGASLVEPGDAVEYGQELLVIELTEATMLIGTDGTNGSNGAGG